MVKVIFLENHENYKIGDIKNVTDGYARNFLIPKGIAELATKEKQKEIKQKIEKLKKEEEKKINEAKKIAEKIAKEKIVIEKEVNEEGHLYGSINPKEIADIINQKEYEIDGSNIVIPESIKEPGKYEIEVRVGHGVSAKLNINIKGKKSS